MAIKDKGDVGSREVIIGEGHLAVEMLETVLKVLRTVQLPMTVEMNPRAMRTLATVHRHTLQYLSYLNGPCVCLFKGIHIAKISPKDV